MLCASLHWLYLNLAGPPGQESFEQRSRQDEPDWIRASRSNTSAIETTSFETPVLRTKRRKTLPQNSANSLDAHVSRLLAFLDDDLEDFGSTDKSNSRNADNNFGFKNLSPKIFYCSRTHSQLAQVLTELQKTSYFEKQDTAIALGSRKNLCCNQKLLSKAYSHIDLNDACLELQASDSGCLYHHKGKESAFADFLTDVLEKHILSTESLSSVGADACFCPYYSSRYLQLQARFVTVPYNIILDPISRTAYNINLKDTVVIFDEAHNIVDFINQMNSTSIPEPKPFFTALEHDLETYKARFFSRLAGSSSAYISQLIILVQSLRRLESFESDLARVYQINEFSHLISIDNINHDRLANYVAESKILRKVQR